MSTTNDGAIPGQAPIDFHSMAEALATELRSTDMVLGAMVMWGKLLLPQCSDENKAEFTKVLIRTSIYREVGNVVKMAGVAKSIGIPQAAITHYVNEIRAELAQSSEDQLNGNSH